MNFEDYEDFEQAVHDTAALRAIWNAIEHLGKELKALKPELCNHYTYIPLNGNQTWGGIQ